MTSLFWLSVPFSGAAVAVLAGPIGTRATMVAACVASAACVLWVNRSSARERANVAASVRDAA